MSVVFDLLLPKGHGRPVVPAVPTVLAGVYDEVAERNVGPDRDAVRAALPHYWRRAFDQLAATFWYTSGARIDAAGGVTEGTCYVSLYSTRRRHLVTIYARPRRIEAKGPVSC